MSKKEAKYPIQSTAGAVPVKNEKGELVMEKVKVIRYISGKRPEYAPQSSSDEESEDEEFIVPARLQPKKQISNEQNDVKDLTEVEKADPRLRRLHHTTSSRRRRIEEPEILDESDEEEENERRQRRGYESDETDSDDELDDEKDIEMRRAILRQRALAREENEIMAKSEDIIESEKESESEYEEYSESEEEKEPRLKPLFVRKSQRSTIKDEERGGGGGGGGERSEESRREKKRDETLKIVESELRSEREGRGEEGGVEGTISALTDVITDEEDEEAEYEAWKLREMKRIKRDREEREALIKEKQEIERWHNLTEEERRQELKLNPKVIVNKASKGKYKFLQKYYHRGVFYIDKEEEVLKRDSTLPTLEDHFDKAVLPKVMQVKNFGRSGRTKYTHLVDQDTTNFESPWVADSTQNFKFFTTQAAGVRQVFEKPSARKKD